MKKFILESIGLVDIGAWVLTVLFFCGSALLFDGDVQGAFLGAAGIIVIMFMVGTSIEVIIETMKNVRGIGTLTGFLTNGPEALVVIVGLINGDILFASSTPLGSNYMNPLLLLLAAVLMRHVKSVLSVSPVYFFSTVIITASLAGVFYLLDPGHYALWAGVALVVSMALFFKRPTEQEPDEEEALAVHKLWFVPSLLILTAAGYFLDPVVNVASAASHAPKGLIGFLVLATLTSWPEFKSALTLLRRDMTVAAVLNIVVSNITNLWLAVAGVGVYLLF
ncbi:MAG: sodium:proton exchanger [Magnetococcales bacterium]|nr:sodium:proton exchanger [Magnetococcales bacterium]